MDDRATFELTFHADPAEFLDVAAEHLAADPVLCTVIASVTEGMVGQELPTGFPCWWLTVHEGGRVVGVAMRTAPFRPHPIYLLPMPSAAVLELARALHARGEQVDGVNGALPGAVEMGEEIARLTGRTASIGESQRLFDLPQLIPPAPVPGALRTAGEGDLPVCGAWFRAFHADAAAQAGRTSDPHAGEHFTDDDVLARIEAGHVHLWEVEGDVVHLTGHSAPAFGVVRVGPVYTPAEHRGRGYASAAVAEVSERALAAGHRACLFTDRANPTSNRIYEALGYRHLADMAAVLVTSR